MSNKIIYYGVYHKLPKMEISLIYVTRNKKIIKAYTKFYGKFSEIKSEYRDIDEVKKIYNMHYMNAGAMIKVLKETDVFLELL